MRIAAEIELTESVIKRFESKIERIPEGGCWVWMDHLSKQGYGILEVNYKPRKAHRISYEIYRKKIPLEMSLDHLCRNKCCVNPWHLEIVTHEENISRANKHFHHERAKTQCPYGHPYDEKNTSYGKKGERYCKECCKNRWNAFRERQKEKA